MEDISDEECNTGLYLGLGIKKEKKQKLVNKLCPKSEAIKVHNSHNNNTNIGERFSLEYYPNATTCSTDSDNNNNDTDRRKKLRLTKEQSAMLENTFKLHNTLNPVQKKTLADQLKLKTRQIEVWFQNRRARTKLKQTEIDYELLKKQYQNLSDENKRLKKELQELKVRQSPLYPPQRFSKPVCSSCDQKLWKRNEENNN